MAESLIIFGQLSVDRSIRRVIYQGRRVPLSPREYAILEALLERPGMPLSRMQLRERLYGESQAGILGNPVQVHIHNLRSKLGEGVIRTIRGLGYVVAKESELQPPLEEERARTPAYDA